jgi:hypothetical protein
MPILPTHPRVTRPLPLAPRSPPPCPLARPQLTFLTLRDPGLLFRAAVIAAQGIAYNAYFLAYILSPRTCHASVGYLEEEATRTYTHALKARASGLLLGFQAGPLDRVDAAAGGPCWVARGVPVRRNTQSAGHAWR